MKKSASKNEPCEIPRWTTDAKSLAEAKTAHRLMLKNIPEQKAIVNNESPIEESEDCFTEKGYKAWQKQLPKFNAMITDFCAVAVFKTNSSELRKRVYCLEEFRAQGRGADSNANTTDWMNDQNRFLLACYLERINAFVFLDDDAEPLYNYQLFPEFALASRGRFAPESISGFETGKNKDRSRIQFIQRETLYFIDIEWNSNWRPDLVQGLIHVCFAQEGISERFIKMHTDRPYCEYVFADPTAFAPIATKYGLGFEKPSIKAGRARE